MAFLQEFRCEICGTVSSNPVHWFVVQCSNSQLTVLKWNLEKRECPRCPALLRGRACAVYISRWFEAACTPPLRDFKTSGAPGQS